MSKKDYSMSGSVVKLLKNEKTLQHLKNTGLNGNFEIISGNSGKQSLELKISDKNQEVRYQNLTSV